MLLELEMPITSTHPLYDMYITMWEDCRSTYEGQRAIKARGQRYLPALSGQTPEEYRAYLQRALFFGIMARTVDALVGLVLQNDPEVKAPASLDYFVTADKGSHFMQFVNTLLTEFLLTGRVGVLVDERDRKPWPYVYGTESVINWREEDDVPSLVVLKENTEVPSDSDKYITNIETYYRELTLDGGVYTSSMYDKAGVIKEMVQPNVGGQPLNYIPFIMANHEGLSWTIIKPPLMDLVDVNLSHYLTSADLEHGRHLTGLPTPIVSGVDADSPLKIGGLAAWVLPDPSAKAYFLEFTGQGLKALENALVEKQGQLASLSARILDNSKRGSEAASTVKLRYISEMASLVVIVRTMSGLILRTLETMNQLNNERDTDTDVVIRENFVNDQLTHQELAALTDAFIKGAISEEVFIYNLRQGSIAPPNSNNVVGKVVMPQPGANANA